MPYIPSELPYSDDELRTFLAIELRRIQETFRLLDSEGAHFVPLHVAPDKPREGLLVIAAAGVLGANEGLYRYNSSDTWVFIG